MDTSSTVVKDSHNFLPVPAEWRQTICEIVTAFKDGDFSLSRGISSVRPIGTIDAKHIEENIEDCDVQLIDLPMDAWRTSVYQWAGQHWDVMIDLYSSEGATDLVMHLHVFEDGSGYAFEVHMAYVP